MTIGRLARPAALWLRGTQRPCADTPHGRSLRESWVKQPRARPAVLQFAFLHLQIEACVDGKWVLSPPAEAGSRFFLAR
jgi:hypothetical protein